MSMSPQERASLLALWERVPGTRPDLQHPNEHDLGGGRVRYNTESDKWLYGHPVTERLHESTVAALARDAIVEWLLSKCKLGILIAPPYRPDTPHIICQRVPAGVMGPSYDNIGEGPTRLSALIAAATAVAGGQT